MDSRLNSLRNLLDGPVLVTGHTGFKGTWLTLLLEELGVEVVGYSLPPEVDSLYVRMGREGKVLEEYEDVRDLNSVQNFISRTKPVAIIHLAAQPLVIESYKSPRETFETNVLGTVNMLDAAFQASQIKAFIGITTDKVYRNDNRGIAFKESDALSGKDPYSASKVGSEAAIAAWQQIAKSVGGPKVVATRAGNVIGGGDWARDRLIPDLIRGFSLGEVVQVRNPASTRPWQHVLDPLIGYLLTLQEVLKGNNIDAINFGPRETSLAVSEVVQIAKKSWGESAIVKIENSSDSVYEASKLELDSMLANELLGWEPVWDQKSAIQSTTEWWKGLFLEGKEPAELCQHDIQFALNRTFL
jgi:CDP-glucose 4,6-dehydratase